MACSLSSACQGLHRLTVGGQHPFCPHLYIADPVVIVSGCSSGAMPFLWQPKRRNLYSSGRPRRHRAPKFGARFVLIPS